MRRKFEKIGIVIEVLALILITGSTFLIEEFQDKINQHTITLLNQENALNYYMERQVSSDLAEIGYMLKFGFNLDVEKQIILNNFGNDYGYKKIYQSYINNSISKTEFFNKAGTHFRKEANEYTEESNALLTDIKDSINKNPVCEFQKFEFSCVKEISFLSKLRIIMIVIIFVLYTIKFYLLI